MRIGGLQKLTLLDFPGHVACTVFLQGCNFRCPFCHNASLVLGTDALREDEVLSFLKKRQGLLDGVAITGGEPLLSADIDTLLEKIKALGYLVKLDTNGSFPRKLRSLKERSAQIKAARARLTGELGREPTLMELSADTGLQPEEIASAETATGATESIQRQCGEDGFSLEDVLTDGEMEEQIVERIALREAIACLSEREQMVIKLRFFHGLTQDKTSKILGVSQVQISRIEKKALAALKNYI